MPALISGLTYRPPPNPSTLGNAVEPSVTVLANGNIVIGWTARGAAFGGDTSGDSIVARVFSSDGSPLGSHIIVNTTTLNNQQRVDIAALENGGFVATWWSNEGTGLRARIFNDNGTAIGNDFEVNTTSVASNVVTPAVAALAGGGFVVTFND